MFVNASNNAVAKLSSNINSSQTSLTVDDASIFPDAPFLITVNEEIMRVTNVSSNTLTVQRGREGTSASSHNVDSNVENNFTAGTYQALVDEIKTLKQQSGIAEMGQNENGSYIRYENGVQMCWNEVYNDDSTSASGALYQKQISFTFPKPFVDIPSVSGTERNDVANYVQWTAIRQVHTDGISAYAICTSQDRPGFYGYQAIGRWK